MSKLFVGSLMVVAILLVFTSSISSFSTGVLPWCDIGSQNLYGYMNNGATGERWTSQNMQWAVGVSKTAAPGIDKRFSLRTGLGAEVDDPKFYTGGQPIEIFVNTLTQERMLGLVMYAVKGENPKYKSDIPYQVGTWEIPSGTPFQVITPDPYTGTPFPYNPAGSCVTHNTAALKPLRNSFWLRIPQGSGVVTIKALVKIGEQNAGQFLMTNEVVLKEDYPAPPTYNIRSLTGESCTQACRRQWGSTSKCSNDLHRKAHLSNSSELIEDFFQVPCKLPYLSTCSLTAPSRNDVLGGFCQLNSDVGCGESQDVSTLDLCSLSDERSSRFCYCSEPDKKPEKSSGASSIDPVVVGVPVGVVAGVGLFAAFVFYGLYKRKQISKTLSAGEYQHDSTSSNGSNSTHSAYTPYVSPTNQAEMGQVQGQRSRPVMPDGRV